MEAVLYIIKKIIVVFGFTYIGYYLCLDPGVARYVILLLLLLFMLLHSSTIHPIVEADLILPHPFMNALQLELETNLREV